MSILTCPNCGAKNRVDPAKARQTAPVCGRCHQALPPVAAGPSGAVDASRPVELTDATFAAFVQTAPVPVLVDCWAGWCGPCRMLAPTIDQLAAESGGRYLVAKLDTDANQRTAGALGISALPTLLIFKGGRVVDKVEGIAPKPVLAARLAAVG
ncbi:MAG: thioredoxin [Phycisphaerae bacterium]|nr:thioredoxin [Tepidisphaeraceae bacterium]